MDDIDEVSSTTKDESAGDSTEVTTAVDTSAPTVGDSEEQGQNNAKKRKSMAGEADELLDVSGSEPVPSSSSVATAASAVTTSAMDTDEGNAEVESSSTPEPMATSSSELAAVDQPSPIEIESQPEVEVELRVSYNKQPIPITISLKKTVGDLKRMIEAVTKIAPELQKVLVKGIPKDEVVLESLGLSAGSKVMVIGTKLDDVLAVNTTPTAAELKGDDGVSAAATSGNWCSIPRHQKILDKGLPDDVMAGILDCHDPLPDFPISGISSKGSKLRLTFKLEADEVWIGTKERTEKVSIGSIRNVTSQAIAGFEHYHILALQLGPTEASRIFIYWFPAQYVMAVKDALSQ